MEYVKIEGAGFSISRIVMGCEQLGGTDWGTVREDEVAKAVGRAIDLGVNAFDTADVYGLGRSEERLASALGSRRHEAIIITKFGVAWEESAAGGRAKIHIDNSEAYMRKALEASLRRLRIESIPIYLVHKPDPKTPLEETMATLNAFKQEGKIRHFGVSNFDAERIALANSLGPIRIAQMEYSLLRRGAEAKEFPQCKTIGATTMSYGVLGFGVLSGSCGAGRKFEKGDRRDRLPTFRGEEYQRSLRVADLLRETAESFGCTIAQVAIGWVLGNDHVNCAIVGVKNCQQMEQAAGTTQLDVRAIRKKTTGDLKL